MSDELEFDLEFEDDFEFDLDTGLDNKDSSESSDVEEVSDEFDFEDDFEFDSDSDIDLGADLGTELSTDLGSDLDTELGTEELSESSENTDLSSKEPSESSERTDSGTEEPSESSNKTKAKGSPLINKVIDIPIINLLICLGLLMGVVAILGGVVMKHYDNTIVANNFGLKYEQEYYISSIDIGDTISVKFQEYDNMGSPGQTVGFNYDYKSTNDAYYILFKYYLKEGDIVLHTDQGMLDRKVVGGTEQDAIVEQNDFIEQDEESEE